MPNALIVEDDSAIALIVETVLRAEGYTTHVTPTADEALRPGLPPPDLLLTDLSLPGTHDGLALSHLLRTRHPNLAVIYMSGSIEDDRPPTGAVPNAALLGKPFRRATLLEAVRTAHARATQ